MTAPVTADERLAVLKAWRDTHQSPDLVSKVSDDDLMRIAYLAGGNPTADSIRKVNLASRGLVSQFADSIAEVLANGLTVESQVGGESFGDTTRGGAGPAPASHLNPTADRAEPGPGDEIDPRAFAPLNLSAERTEHEVVQVGVEVDPGGLRLSWRPFPGKQPIVIYRLISRDEDAPPSPEYGTPVGVTTEAWVVDDHPFERAIRFYRVWVNTGADLAAAYAAQPELWAEGVAVAPVGNCTFQEMEGQVIGSWTAAPGTTKVEVLRHPVAKREYRPQYRLEPERENDPQLLGIVDRTGEGGAKYEYSVYAVALVGGRERLSAPITHAVSIPVVPVPVTDLTAETHYADGKGLLDISWTHPAVGDVEVYLTEEEPDPALHRQGAIEASRLATTPLRPELRLPIRPTVEGSRRTVHGAPWRHNWYRVYITPVTLAGGLAWVGKSKPFKRMDPVRDSKLRDRVDSQIVVFDWPDGAAQVAAFVTPPRQELDWSQRQDPMGQLSYQDYERQGGLLLRLDGSPCDVHLVPRAWDAGSVVNGTPETLSYPGLVRIEYEIRPQVIKQRRWRGETTVQGPPQVLVRSDRELPEGVEFVLVQNRERLPLYPGDSTPGTRPLTKTVTLRRGAPTVLFELPNGLPSGYVRLFGSSVSRIPIAVIDPYVGKLHA